MQLTDKIFKGLYRRGVMLEQMKEPALRRTVKQLLPVEPCENPRDCEGLSAEEILLAAQQAETQRAMVGREVGVLFEKPGRMPGQVTGKSDHLHAVFADGPDSLIGEVARVRIVESAPHSLKGVLVG